MTTHRKSSENTESERPHADVPKQWNDDTPREIPDTLKIPDIASESIENLNLKKANQAALFINQVKSDMQMVAGKLSAAAAATETGHDDSEPPLIGRFELIRPIGEGGFAKVFLAHDPLLNREVALKVPKPAALMSEESKIRFEREAQTAAMLAHPNIASVFEAGSIGPLVFIASEYFLGPNLSEWFDGHGKATDQRTAAKIVATLAEGAHYAHKRGIIHRDLKPSNVLIAGKSDEDESQDTASDLANRLRITDFGLARQLESGTQTLTEEGAVVGTPAYMSPEQARGEADISAASDIYSLGVILYELLTGKPPFLKSTHLATLRAVDEKEVPRLHRPGDKVAPDLEAICLKCLQKKPDQRYKSAFALAEDLNRFCANRPVKARKPTSMELLIRWIQRNPALAASLTFAFTSLLAGLIASSNLWLSAEMQKSRAETNVKLLHDTIRKSLSEYASMGKEKLKDPQQQKLVSQMLVTHRTLLDQESEAVDVDREMVDSYMKIYKLYRKLGMFPEAFEVCQHAKSLVRRSLKQPGNSSSQMQLMEFEIEIQIAATLHAQGRHDETIEPLEELVKRYRQFDEEDGQSISATRWFDLHRNLGLNMYSSNTRQKDAHLHFQLAFGYAITALAEENNSRNRQNYSKSLQDLGLVSKHKVATPLYEQALEVMSRLDERTEDRLEYAEDIAIIHSEIGRCHYEEKNYEQAEKCYQLAITRLNEGLLLQPDNIEMQSRLVHIIRRLASAKQRQGDIAGARKELARGLASVDQIKYEHIRLGLKSKMCVRWVELALEQGDPIDERTWELLEQAFVACREGIEKYPDNLDLTGRLVWAFELRALCLEAERKIDESFEARTELQAELEKVWKDMGVNGTNRWRRLVYQTERKFSAANRLKEAKAFLDERLNHANDDPLVRYELAKSYFLLATDVRQGESSLDPVAIESDSFEQLELAVQFGFRSASRIKRNKAWDRVRSDDRFISIVGSFYPKK